MAYLHVLFVVLATLAICSSLPVLQGSSKTNIKFSESSTTLTRKELVIPILSETVHSIVKRSKRGGIIQGNSCPEGEGMLPNGECVPCVGRHLIGCPDIDYGNGEDYDE